MTTHINKILDLDDKTKTTLITDIFKKEKLDENFYNLSEKEDKGFEIHDNYIIENFTNDRRLNKNKYSKIQRKENYDIESSENIKTGSVYEKPLDNTEYNNSERNKRRIHEQYMYEKHMDSLRQKQNLENYNNNQKLMNRQYREKQNFENYNKQQHHNQQNNNQHHINKQQMQQQQMQQQQMQQQQIENYNTKSKFGWNSPETFIPTESPDYNEKNNMHQQRMNQRELNEKHRETYENYNNFKYNQVFKNDINSDNKNIREDYNYQKEIIEKFNELKKALEEKENEKNNCSCASDHVKNCDVCNKLYKNDNTLYIIAIIFLSVICLILLKRVLEL
jgi:hypothetical protein